MGLMAMAATFWATALLMAAVCCWASFLLSMLITLKPYLAAFFWYIFQEKAWDGFVIVAMNARVGLSPPAAADGASDPAAALAPAEAGADDADPELHAATTRTRAPRAAAPRPKCLEIVTCSPPWLLRLKPEVYT